MSRLTYILTVALIIGVASKLSAQSSSAKEDLSNQIIAGAWGDPTKCNFANAASISFSEAAAGVGVANGACVSITAYWEGRAIYGYEADANIAKASITSKLKGRRVGIYADERTLDVAPHRPLPFTIVGSYASCSTEWPGAMMVLGYCHYSDGPFLKVSQTRPARKRDVR